MIDISHIISTTRDYNLHSHTQFCDGKATMAEFASEAERIGMQYYGFTPHSPVPLDSPCNMKKCQVDEYMSEFRRLKEQYASKVNLYAGMEIDYLGDDWGPSHPYFEQIGLDYKIGSVHFIPTPDGNMIDIDGRFERFKRYVDTYFDGDIEEVVNRYFRQSFDMVEKGGFDIMGHPDKIGHNAAHYRTGIEQENWYKRWLNELGDCIINNNIVVELNMKAYADHSHRTFPSAPLLQQLIKAGVKIVVNSDAHRSELINASRREGFELIDSINQGLFEFLAICI